jgi:triacylglycerol lipase
MGEGNGRWGHRERRPVRWMALRLGGLSPRGKVLAAGIALILPLTGVVAAAVVTRAGSGGQPAAGRAHPGGSGPGEAASGAAAPSEAASGAAAPGEPAQDRPGPVLLVPGYGGKTSDLSGLAARIRATGREAIVVRLPGNGTGDLTADARALNAAVARALAAGAPSVDVIGYSAGGVVALLWARNDGGAQKARRVITLGSPFHGTAAAAAAEAFVPSRCPVACKQLVPGSSLLARLDATAVPARPPWLSLWSTDDLLVTPPESARLSGAIDVPLQSVCAGSRVSHEQLPADPVVAGIVLRAIGRAPLRYPTAANCRA